MSSELLFLIIAVLAFLADRFLAGLSVKSIQVLGYQSVPDISDRPDAAESQEGHTLPEYRVFCIVLQNDERVPLEWLDRPVRVTIGITGQGRFSPGDRGIELIAGPDDTVECRWVIERRRVEMAIRRMRPLKTWVFRCNVDADVQEVECSLDIPTTSWVRRLIERVNSAVFHSERFEYHTQRIVVRKCEDDHMSRKVEFTRRLRILTVTPALVFGVACYVFLNERLIAMYGTDHSGWLAMLGTSRWSVIGAGAIVCGALLLVYELARTDPMPIAQGYQMVRSIAPREGSSAS